MDSLGSFIRKKRNEANITLKALADRTDLSQGYLSNLENNIKKRPSPEVLQKIAYALGIDHFLLLSQAGYVAEEPTIEYLENRITALDANLIRLRKENEFLQDKLRENKDNEELYDVAFELVSDNWEKIELAMEEQTELRNKLAQKQHQDFHDSFTPEELDAYIEEQHLQHEIDEFRRSEYPDIEELLMRGGKLYFNKYELTHKDKKVIRKVLFALFEDQEQNYPSEEEIKDHYIARQRFIENLQRISERESSMKKGEK
ncbi:helix-turn-helix transcriptional regulator [Sporosarcina luteola]|uniref:helix-turn-helix domain-containing protein n=1 Tax=Sporosarcina luteola TaxID=582850 RepID=UPI00203F57A8|nr:helix-turn-helix transcriptional regulator [Sporosarcina luteola]MCM3637741.1 helix-turn-helix transcriptional regulator [Sporosarcina luteola]